MKILEIFELTVKQYPNSIALVTKERTFTYHELNTLVNKLSNVLTKTYHVKAEEIVAFIADNTEWAIVSVLGILKAGAAFLPIDPSFPVRRKEFMLVDSDVRLYLNTSYFLYDADFFDGDVFLLDIQLNQVPDSFSSFLLKGIQPTDLAYVNYTSGTTGFPKGVMVQHNNLENYIRWVNYYYFEGRTGFHFPLFTSLAFDLTLTSLFSTLLRGDKIYLFNDSVDVALSVILSEENDINTVKLTPSHITLIGDMGLKSTNIELLIAGGESLTNKHVSILKQLNSEMKLFNEYGPTETTVGSTVKLIEDVNEEIVIGTPIGNTKIYVLSDTGKVQSVGSLGEICIAGDGVSRGYLNNPELTAEKFIPNHLEESNEKYSVLYKTGDIGYLLPNKNLKLINRKDDQIKLRGHRVELNEISNVLQKNPLVDFACVVAKEANSLTAFVVPNKDLAHTVREIVNFKPKSSLLELYELPNGLHIHQKNKSETKLVYYEVFKEETYLKHGIKINKGDTIVDIGANIGMATLFFSLNFQDIKVYSFEPIPAIFECLKANVSLYNVNAKIFNCGISNKSQEVIFKYYPNNTVLSGYYGDLGEEKQSVRSYLINEANQIGHSFTDEQVSQLLEERVYSQDVVCNLRKLSEVIEEERISSIDLLKVDVEKSEFDVLEGIGDNWDKIKQVIIEIHDVDNRLSKVELLLKEKGFKIVYEQDAVLKGTNIYNVYGIKEALAAGKDSLSPKDRINEFGFYYNPEKFIKSLQEDMGSMLPSYMLPDDIFLITEIPLTTSGKIDKRTLLKFAEEKKSERISNNYLSPSNPIEKDLVKIWEETLNEDRIGVRDNFFEIGGNSLLAIKAINLINIKFPKSLDIADLFTYKNISELAGVIANKGQNSTVKNDDTPTFNCIEI